MGAGLDFADLANAVTEHNYDFWADLTFRNNSLFDFASSPYAIPGEDYEGEHGAIPIDGPVGGETERFMVLAASHTATEFTEYDVIPEETSDTWIYAEPGVISVWEPILVTGFAKDSAYGPEDIVGVIERNAENAARAIRDKINTLIMGTGAKSLTGWIDNSTAAGGINRTTYSAWQSAVTAVGGVLTMEDMDDLVETVCDADRGALEDDLEWWTCRGQRTNYRRLAGIGGALAQVPQQVQSTGGKLDLGFSEFSHNGIPIRAFPDMTTTEWYLVHKPSIRIQEKRGLTVVLKDYQGDGERLLMSWRGSLRIGQPNKCGKLETVTA